MYKGICSLIACIILSAVFSLSLAKEADTVIVDTFSTCVKGNMPCGWKKFKSNKGVSVQQISDNYFLNMKSSKDVEGIGKKFEYDIKNYPVLHWSWRATELPQNGQENIKKRNDSALGVYVFFKGGYPFGNAVKYVWSTTLPSGKMVKSPYSKKTAIIVIQTAEKDLNKWIQEERNVLDDYKKAFGSEPPLAQGIAVMTDSDNTNSKASADYDNFFITRE